MKGCSGGASVERFGKRDARTGWPTARRIQKMPRGVITYFNDQKGYGFIESDEKNRIFVHFSSIRKNGYKTLKEGEEVWFEVGESQRGIEAFNVRKL
jgi:CspA family cold shock protein